MSGWVHRSLMAIAMAAAQICFAQAADLQVETREGVRTAIVLPADSGPAPTVIVLHGAFSSAAWTARHYGFADAAAARGFAVVFPQGIKGQWNDGRSNKPWKPNDVAFLKVLVGELIAERVAEPSRIYLTGISAGGMMTLRMLCEASDLFAGAGTVIANMPVATGAGCQPARPVPIVMFNGSADPWVPYRGGGIGPLALGGVVWGTERTADFMAHANGCGARPTVSDASMDAMSVTRFVWTGCERRANVTLYRVNGGGHEVYGSRKFLPAFASGRRHMVSAAETIIAAFANE
jgi:polyhydroxybutyrate depolymerase